MPPPPEHTRWQPGQSGNPAGYSRGRRITDALIALIEDKGAEKPLASVWLRKALEGDPKFFAMLLDRVEGKVAEADDDKGKAQAIEVVYRDEGIDSPPASPPPGAGGHPAEPGAV